MMVQPCSGGRQGCAGVIQVRGGVMVVVMVKRQGGGVWPGQAGRGQRLVAVGIRAVPAHRLFLHAGGSFVFSLLVTKMMIVAGHVSTNARCLLASTACR